MGTSIHKIFNKVKRIKTGDRIDIWTNSPDVYWIYRYRADIKVNGKRYRNGNEQEDDKQDENEFFSIVKRFLPDMNYNLKDLHLHQFLERDVGSKEYMINFKMLIDLKEDSVIKKYTRRSIINPIVFARSYITGLLWIVEYYCNGNMNNPYWFYPYPGYSPTWDSIVNYLNSVNYSPKIDTYYSTSTNGCYFSPLLCSAYIDNKLELNGETQILSCDKYVDNLMLKIDGIFDNRDVKNTIVNKHREIEKLIPGKIVDMDEFRTISELDSLSEIIDKNVYMLYLE
jgi:hypothetical protein